MDYSIIVSVIAVGVSAVSLFYGIGRDSKPDPQQDSKIDQLIATTTDMSRKLDKVAEWHREATAIHASHGEQLKTLFNRVSNLENRMEDREAMTKALQKILEKVS